MYNNNFSTYWFSFSESPVNHLSTKCQILVIELVENLRCSFLSQSHARFDTRFLSIGNTVVKHHFELYFPSDLDTK